MPLGGRDTSGQAGRYEGSPTLWTSDLAVS